MQNKPQPPVDQMYGSKDLITQEVVQGAILASIFREHLGHTGNLTLKGGQAMRYGANSFRLTDDIDLQSDAALPISTLQRTMHRAFSCIENLPFVDSIQWSLAKDTETTQRWKIKIQTDHSRLNLKVEISRRKTLDVGSGERIATDDLPVLVDEPVHSGWERSKKIIGHTDALPLRRLTPAGMLITKLAAAAQRERARDVWDLKVLMDMEITPTPGLMAQIPTETLMAWQNNIAQTINAIGYTRFQDEVAARLPDYESRAVTREEWSLIQVRVYEFCHNCVQEELDRRDGSAPPKTDSPENLPPPIC